MSIELPRISILTGSAPELLGDLCASRGWERVAIICGRTFSLETGLPDRLSKVARGDVMIWDRGEPHAPVDSVGAAAEAVSEFRPDVLVSAGGGSSHDLTKGIATIVALGGQLLDHCLEYYPPDDLRPHPLPGPKIPIVTIPSTLSGSEANGAGGFAVEGRKRVLADPSLTPTAVLIDHEVLASTPREIFLGSVTNAIDHCVEGLVSRRSDLVTSGLLGSALPELAEAGTLVATQPAPDVFERLGVASAVTGIALPGCWLGLAHAIGHVIGASSAAPHGACHAVVAGTVVRFNAEEDDIAAAYRRTSSLLGLEADPEALADWLDSLAGAWDLPASLLDLGIAESELPSLAVDIWRDHDTFHNPRRPADPTEVEEVLRRIPNGGHE
jgi:alcohol dehydrogenase